MEWISGNIYIRTPQAPMAAGQEVLGHAHSFDHTTFCRAGALKIELLESLPTSDWREMLNARTVETFELRASDPTNWLLILAGRCHRITAIEDGSVYQCVYAHRAPQAVSALSPIHTSPATYTKRDMDGNLWVRVDESVVQESKNWSRAYS